MAFLAAALPYIAAAGTVISTVSSANAQKQAGLDQQAANEFAARQADDQANAARSTAQRRAFEERRQGRLAASRAQAVGAAGGGAGSFDVVTRVADLESQGEYGALVAMYEGEDAARGMGTQANVMRFEGDQAKKAGKKAATGTLIAGAANLASKYGGGSAPSTTEAEMSWGSGPSTRNGPRGRYA